MSEPVRVIGTYLSPYVRKVLVVLALKGVPYEIDPIVPFFGNDEFSKLSPVRRIPVLIDEQVTLADSSVICQYLEERYPEPALYPADIAQRARARWLEEYADTRMGDVFIWRLFNEIVITPYVWGKPREKERIEKIKTTEIPDVLDYLESQAPTQGYLFGDLSIADISIAAFFRNAALCRLEVDAARWPKTAAFVQRVLSLKPFTDLVPLEQLLVRTPIPQHRQALGEAGAPLSATSVGSRTPRKGPLSV